MSLHFLALRTSEKETLLLSLRGKVATPVPEDSVVLLAVLAGLHDEDKTNSGFAYYAYFQQSCNDACATFNGMTPIVQNGKADFLACAWFPKGNVFQTVLAASSILQNLLRSPAPHRRPALLALGRHEYAACRLLESAGDDQVVVDDLLWKRLSQPVRRLAETTSVHTLAPPQERAKTREAKTATRHDVLQDFLRPNSHPLPARKRGTKPTAVSGRR